MTHSQRPAGAANEDRTSASKGNEQELASLVSKLRNNVRNISHELMPPEFEHLSLDQILDRYAAKLTENTGIEVSYHPTENNASRQSSQ